MVKVFGTKGNVVNVEILGIGNVMRMLRSAGKKIESGADLGVIRAGGFIEEEVKESIIGNRAENKSVDSGLFANSIEFKKIGHAVGIIKPKRKKYPNSTQTTEDIAKILEFSSNIKRGPRRHFGNTAKRNRIHVRDIINGEVVKEVNKNIRAALSTIRRFI